MTRDEELILINQALSTPKYRRITSEEYLSHFFALMTRASKESRERVIKANNRGVARRSNNMKLIRDK